MGERGGARSGDAFDDGGVGHAAALAHGLQTVLNTFGRHAVDEGGHQPGAGPAERVADGDGAAARVEPVRASGVRPSSLALSEVIISTAAAPSLICEELPAWMTPPSLKAGLSPASFSGLVPRRRPSSVSNTRPSGSSTGAIWPASRPSSAAAASLAWEALENSSSWSRDRPHFSAIISAPMPWLNVTP